MANKPRYEVNGEPALLDPLIDIVGKEIAKGHHPVFPFFMKSVNDPRDSDGMVNTMRS